MCIWGSLGLFVRNIPLPSSVIANCRGMIGLLFLLLVMGLKHPVSYTHLTLPTKA